MNAPTSRKGPQALDIKSATIYTVRLVLHSADTTELLEALDLRMQGAGAFFQNEPVVIDSTAIPDPIDWESLITALRHHQLHPIGMMGQADQQIAAAQYGLPAVELSSTKTTIDLPEPEPEPEPAEPITQAAPMIVRQPLRSGQRLYASKFREDVDLTKVMKIINWTLFALSDEETSRFGTLDELGEDMLDEYKEYLDIMQKCFYKSDSDGKI